MFVGSVVWQVPIGSSGSGRKYQPGGIAGALLADWDIAAIVTRQSGIPLAVTQATNFNAFAGFGTQRPNRVGEPELPSSERTTARWFNTDAFAIAPQFTLGNSSRNPVRGPGYSNVDLAIARRFALPDAIGPAHVAGVAGGSVQSDQHAAARCAGDRRGKPRLRGDYISRGSPRPAVRRQNRLVGGRKVGG